MRWLSLDIRDALRLRGAGRKREAIKLFEKMAKAHKADALFWFYFAEALDSLGRERQAILRYHRALGLDPKHPHLYQLLLYLSSSYRKIGRVAAAHRYLKRAEKMGRKSPLQTQLRSLIDRALARLQR